MTHRAASIDTKTVTEKGWHVVDKSMFVTLPGLPAHGPLPRAFPESFADSGKEGFVVEFLPGTDNAWICNFEPGIGGLTDARIHPNNRDVLVFAAGSCVVVNPFSGDIDNLVPAAFQVFELKHPNRLLISNQDMEFTCIGKDGVLWKSSRISWEGFNDLVLENEKLTGLAWNPTPTESQWIPFSLDLHSGKHAGGSYVETAPSDYGSSANQKKRSVIWFAAIIVCLLICSALSAIARISGFEFRLFDFYAYIRMENLTIKYPPSWTLRGPDDDGVFEIYSGIDHSSVFGQIYAIDSFDFSDKDFDDFDVHTERHYRILEDGL
jgi:hypothetical protein